MDAFFRRKYLTLFPEATPTPGALKISRVTLTLSGGWGPLVDPLRLTADPPVNAPGTPLPLPAAGASARDSSQTYLGAGWRELDFCFCVCCPWGLRAPSCHLGVRGESIRCPSPGRPTG